MTASDKLKVGDIVWIGNPGDPAHKVTWKITRLDAATDGLVYATLRSGQSERSRVAPVSGLTKYRITEEDRWVR